MSSFCAHLSATEYPASPVEPSFTAEIPPLPDEKIEEDLQPVSPEDRSRATHELAELLDGLDRAHEIKVSLLSPHDSEYRVYIVDDECRRHLLNLVRRVRIAEKYSPQAVEARVRCELEFYDEQGHQFYRFDALVIRPDGGKEAYRLDGALFVLDEGDFIFYRDLLRLITNRGF